MINKATLLGRVGKDPELMYAQSGATIVSFSLATSEKYKDKETTEWHNIKAFGKLGEIIAEYVRKGSLLYIEGKIQYDSWEKDGEKKYKTVIIANTMKMLDGKKQSDTPSDDRRSYYGGGDEKNKEDDVPPF